MKKISFFLISILLIVACNKNNQDDPNSISDHQAAYDVYSTYLMPLSSIHMILNRTDPNLNCSLIPESHYDSLGIDITNIEECAEVNATAIRIDQTDFHSGVHPLISEQELEELTFEGAKEKYSAVGLFIFGYPYFFDNGNKVMFERTNKCGNNCFSQEIIVMEKDGEYWSQIYSYMIEISK